MDPNSITAAIQTIASQGVLGSLVVIIGIGYYMKDRRVSMLRDKIEALQEKRLEDVIKWKMEALQITNKINDVVDTLTNLVKRNK